MAKKVKSNSVFPLARLRVHIWRKFDELRMERQKIISRRSIFRGLVSDMKIIKTHTKVWLWVWMNFKLLTMHRVHLGFKQQCHSININWFLFRKCLEIFSFSWSMCTICTFYTAYDLTMPKVMNEKITQFFLLTPYLALMHTPEISMFTCKWVSEEMRNVPRQN